MNGQKLDRYTRACLFVVAAAYAMLWLAANVVRRLLE